MGWLVRLSVIPILIAASGCAINQGAAGLVYFHKQSLGLDVAAGEASGSPVHINIGYSDTRGTFVPVAVTSNLTQVLASGRVDRSGEGKDLTAKDDQANDVFSIFSSFELRSLGATTGVSANFGNVFATGFAARRLADAQGAQACASLAIEAKNASGSVQAALNSAIERLCGASPAAKSSVKQ